MAFGTTQITVTAAVKNSFNSKKRFLCNFYISFCLHLIVKHNILKCVIWELNRSINMFFFQFLTGITTTSSRSEYSLKSKYVQVMYPSRNQFWLKSFVQPIRGLNSLFNSIKPTTILPREYSFSVLKNWEVNFFLERSVAIYKLKLYKTVSPFYNLTGW